LALSKATGRGHTRALRYGSDDTYWYPDEAFAACFSRAVRRLMARGMLTPDVRPYGLAIPDGHWRLPYVRRTD
jgi:hypothetical protein